MRGVFFGILFCAISVWGGFDCHGAADGADNPANAAPALASAQEAARQGKEADEQGNYEAALAQYAQALELFRAAGRLPEQAELASDLAVVYRKVGKLDQSLTLQQQAVNSYKMLGDARGQAIALRRLGVLYHQQGKLFQAIAAQEESLELMRQQGDQEEMAKAFSNLGTIYGDLGRLQQAQAYFERASAIYTQFRNQEGVSYTLGNLGQLFLYLGKSQQALQYLEQSLALKQTLADAHGQANTLLNIGTAHKNLGDLQKALAFEYQALALYRQLRETSGEAVTLGNIGLMYEEFGDLEQALQFQLQSYQLKKQHETPVQLAMALTNLASLASKQQRLAEAQEYLQAGLALVTEQHLIPVQAHIYGQLGLLQLKQNLFPEAAQNFTRAQERYAEIGSQKGLLETYDYIGQTYLAQQLFAEARPHYEQALRLAQELNDLNSLWTVQYRLGQVEAGRGRADAALTYFRAAVETVEQMRSYLNVPELRQVFLQKELNPYAQVIRLLLAKQEPAEALVYLERFKARTFLEIVAYGEPQFQAVPALIREERELSARIRYLREKLTASFGPSVPITQAAALPLADAPPVSEDIAQELSAAKEQYEQLLVRIKLAYPDYYRLKTVDADEIRQFISKARALLEPDVAVLEYFLDDTAVHIWIIRQNRIDYVSAPVSDADVLKKVLALRAQLRWYESPAIYPLLQDLYAWLIAPAQPYLTDTATIGIVPFRILHFVPFSALLSAPMPVGASDKETIPAYLIEKYALFTLPSLSLLPVVREKVAQNAAQARRSPRPYFLGMGTTQKDLPGANAEILAIAAQFPGSQGYLGAAATKQRFLAEAGQYAVVHLATHGVYDKRHPLFSYLEFSPESYIYAQEIFGLRLAADLVTLSGCETLLPQQVEAADLHTLVSGDELVGFIRAFMYAGAPAVLSSLWQVSDSATQTLMHVFYHNLPQVGKAQALRQASQAVMRSTIRIGRHQPRELRLVHPFFWSAFVLMGDWK